MALGLQLWRVHEEAAAERQSFPQGGAGKLCGQAPGEIDDDQRGAFDVNPGDKMATESVG
jgi:hypothetical protein